MANVLSKKWLDDASAAAPDLAGRERLVGAAELEDKGLRSFVSAFDTPEPGYEILQFVVAVGGLGSVRIAGGALTGLRRTDVQVVGGSELQRVLSI
jgi:hypothetical protein